MDTLGQRPINRGQIPGCSAGGTSIEALGRPTELLIWSTRSVCTKEGWQLPILYRLPMVQQEDDMESLSVAATGRIIRQIGWLPFVQ